MWLYRNLGSDTEQLTILYSEKGYLREESLLSKLCQFMEKKLNICTKMPTNGFITYYGSFNT